MNKQLTLSTLTDELGQAATHKKEFLQQIDRIIPWGEWKGIIEPYYYKGERGNKPFDLELMLRIHLVQSLYSLSDMATMMEIIDSRAFSEFCGVDSSSQIPDGDTIGRFRALLVKNSLQEKLFAQVVGLLSVQGLILKRVPLLTLPSSPPHPPRRTERRNGIRMRTRRRKATRGTSAIRRT